MAGGGRNRLFAGRIEEAFGLQADFQRFKRLLQRPQARRFQVLDHDLEVTAAFVKSNLAPDANLVAFPRKRADALIGAPEHRTPYLRSEEHTSELQSRPHLVCRLLLEKKKTN